MEGGEGEATCSAVNRLDGSFSKSLDTKSLAAIQYTHIQRNGHVKGRTMQLSPALRGRIASGGAMRPLDSYQSQI